MLRSQFLTALCGLVLLAFPGTAAEKYSGPRPPQPDVPYLLHADNLVSTEAANATEEKRKDGTAYAIAGAGTSTARTPMAEPIFIFESKTISPEKLGLYRLDVKNGRREVFFPTKAKRGQRPLLLSVKRLSDNLYRIEASQFLENGQYSLSPDGSNQVFCFEVY